MSDMSYEMIIGVRLDPNDTPDDLNATFDNGLSFFTNKYNEVTPRLYLGLYLGSISVDVDEPVQLTEMSVVEEILSKKEQVARGAAELGYEGEVVFAIFTELVY